MEEPRWCGFKVQIRAIGVYRKKMRKQMLEYRAINNNFYFNNQLLFVFEENNYMLYSLGNIKTPEGDILLKYRRFFWKKRKVKILKYNLEHKVEFDEEGLSFFNSCNKKIYKISIESPFKIIGKFEAKIYVNSVLFGHIYEKYEKRKNVYYFSFTESNSQLSYYCMILFAINHYYYLDEIP